MSICTNRDTKMLFPPIFIAFIVFCGVTQCYVKLTSGAFQVWLLLFSCLLFLAVTGICFLYVSRQQKLMEDAIRKMEQFLAGDENARIPCENEGSLYKLFHTVNTLATILGAHADQEEKRKDFLKTTISDISHQLKTPLAALAIYNSILQEEGGEGGPVQEFALKSEKEIERIEILVQSLLKITRLDAGAIVMERHEEQIEGMMTEIRQRFETRMEMEEKTVILSGTSGDTLLCDRNWTIEAVSNVVKNALDHTGAGDRIEITWNSLPAITRIVVKDDGRGIHPEDIHHIFKRFYRSRFSKDTRGSGLGLSLVKAIVEAQGGTVTADSDYGEGSVFVMSFPNLTKM